MTGLIYTFKNKENGNEYIGQPIEARDYAHYYEAFNLCAGDITTIKSVGPDTITLSAITLAGRYNVSTIIERYN